MARPALVPALVFFCVSLLVTRPEMRLLAAAPLPWLAWCASRGRPFDRRLLLAALLLGLLHGGAVRIDTADAVGRAALEDPVVAPFERSWERTLIEAPKARDGDHGLLRADGLELEVQLARSEDRNRIMALRAGDRLRVWARTRYRPERGVFVGNVKSPLLIERVEGVRVTPSVRMQRWRDALVRRVWRLYGEQPDRAGFLAAVLLGDRSWHDAETGRTLRAAGLAHLLAISGLHVGVVAGCLLALARRSLRHRFVLWLLVALALAAFGFLVGWGVPVRRAVAAATVAAAGRGLGRDGEPLNRLACVAVVLAWIVGGGTDDAPFALSFCATAGILFASRGAGAWRVSVSAYLATAPLCAAWFGELSPWAPPANLLALPLVALLLLAGYGSIALAGVPWLGSLATTLTAAAHDGILGIAGAVDALPASPWHVAAPRPGVLLALVLSAVVLLTAPRGRIRRAASALFAIGTVLLHLGPCPTPARDPRLDLFDVGQGQALVWSARGEVSLIDAGGRGFGRWDPGAAIVRPALLAAGLRRLDRLILSHGHADHAGGAFAVIEALEIGELWLPPGWWRDRRLSALASSAAARGAGLRVVWAGIHAGGLTVVAPERSAGPQGGNAGSLALTLGRRPHAVLVPGDRDGTALEATLDAGRLTRASILVLAHHGSESGTPDALLDRVRPDLALVSCGWRNRFGHPRATSLERLRSRSIPLWRTDHHGSIALRAAGTGWEVAISPRASPGTR